MLSLPSLLLITRPKRFLGLRDKSLDQKACSGATNTNELSAYHPGKASFVADLHVCKGTSSTNDIAAVIRSIARSSFLMKFVMAP